MDIRNPYPAGSVSCEIFSSVIRRNKTRSIHDLRVKLQAAETKADNFLNYSDSQRTAFEHEATALEALINAKQQYRQQLEARHAEA